LLSIANRTEARQKQANFTTDYKGDTSPVTTIDRENQADIIKDIHALVSPEVMPVLGEENGCDIDMISTQTSNYWLVDPVDGTVYLGIQATGWGVSLAALLNNVPVLGFIAQPGNVIFGGSCMGSVLTMRNDGDVHPLARPLYSDQLIGLELGRTAAQSTFMWTVQRHLINAFKCRGNSHTSVQSGFDLFKGQTQFYCTGTAYPWDLAGIAAIAAQLGFIVRDFDGKPVVWSPSKERMKEIVFAQDVETAMRVQSVIDSVRKEIS
jgi:3'(2'), 5'-bisphosphate nucleotidase